MVITMLAQVDSVLVKCLSDTKQDAGIKAHAEDLAIESSRQKIQRGVLAN